MKYRIEPDPNSIFFHCVEDCNDTMMLTNTNGEILYVNPAWERLYGYSKAEALGKKSNILHSGKHHKSFYDQMWSSISNPKTGYWRGEVVNRTKQGSLVSMLLMITPFKREDGSICGYIGVATDISAQKRLEMVLKQHEILSAVRQFAEGLAHELGTVLAVVRGRAELILSHPNDVKKITDESHTIVKQADRIQELISYLLRFCRSTEPVDIQEIKLKSMIEDFKKHINNRAPHLSIQFQVNFPESFKLIGDQKRIKEILFGFLNNAVDAIEESSVKNKKIKHEITLNAEEIEGEFQIVIQDNGSGIPDENLNKIFQPYFTTKEIGKATGLGLSIASRLAQDMGGRVSVQSESGFGSSFILHLPKNY